ncbi:hypothetical protein ACFYP6_21435 [Streptomyces goshikiensis]|uniref:hypothetical protein n=1 Tax=Streptomyces goshikiensis TaxID=1942 RepID=UPI0036BA4F35
MFSTELPTEGPLTVHALQVRGTGGTLNGPLDTPSNHLDRPIDDANIYPGIQPPSEGDESPVPSQGSMSSPSTIHGFGRSSPEPLPPA